MDRFSVLSDELIHELIFPLLGMNEIIRIGVLSRRFLRLSISSPYLYIHSTIYNWKQESDLKFRRKYNRFCSIMDGYFDGKKTIKSFRLQWDCPAGDNATGKFPRVCGWIEKAIAVGSLRELDLHLSGDFHHTSDIVFELPSCVFTCQTLKVLKLKTKQGLFRWPASLHSLIPSPLEVLALEALTVEVSVDGFDFLGKWISDFCPSLKKLLIENVMKVIKLNITNSSLEDLSVVMPDSYGIEFSHLNISAEKLQILNLDIPCRQRVPVSVKIFAPNLKTLSWKGNQKDYSHWGNFLCLQYANVTYVERSLYYGEVADYSGLGDLLHSISSTRVLEIEGLFINKLSGEEEFENLHHLVLKYEKFEHIQIQPLASFLARLVNLKKLTVHSLSKDESGYYSRYISRYGHNKFNDHTKVLHLLDVDESIKMLSTHLEEVEIEITGQRIEIEMVKYFLKHGKSLEKLTIFYPESYIQVLASAGLQNFEIASSNVTICTVPK